MRGRLGNPFDQTYSEHAGAQRRHQKNRQQAVNQFRRQVHEQADEAQRPDGAGNGRLMIDAGLPGL